MTDATDTHDAVRSRMRAHLETQSVSINEAARGVGMSAPAVSSFLGAKYRGDNAKIARLVARWLDTEREVAEMRTAGLGRHAELAVTMQVQGLAGHAQANRDLVLVYGAAGNGKSYALERYCEERSGATYVVMSPAVTTAATLLGRIARELDAGAGVTTAARLERVVVEQLTGRHALLVVDEAHHLSAALLDEVRCVHDMAGCGLVLSGNDPLWSRLASGERAAQLVSRIGARCRLGRPSELDALALAETLLGREARGATRKLILDTARGMGGLRACVKQIAQASMLARADDAESVSDTHLSEASAQMGVGV